MIKKYVSTNKFNYDSAYCLLHATCPMAHKVFENENICAGESKQSKEGRV